MKKILERVVAVTILLCRNINLFIELRSNKKHTLLMASRQHVVNLIVNGNTFTAF